MAGPAPARRPPDWRMGSSVPTRSPRPPKGSSHAVLDTPAGLHGRRLGDVLKLADRIIVPLQPSVFDIFATRAFLGQLAEHRRRAGRRVGVVGMRVDARTKAAEQLHHFVDSLGLPGWAICATRKTVHLAAGSRCSMWRPHAWRVTWSSGICAWLDAENRQAHGVAVTRLTGSWAGSGAALPACAAPTLKSAPAWARKSP